MSYMRIDIQKFRESGFLQELNRQFLHPLGLALTIAVEPDGTERLDGIWDRRDDPVGIIFDLDDPATLGAMQQKAEQVKAFFDSRANARETALGYIVQPLDRQG